MRRPAPAGVDLTSLSFRHPFRKYQQLILDQIAADRGDHRYHIAAPPGSGKTIVGLELIRRFAHPAVVFTPTTTIQNQWREKVALFLPPGTPMEILDGWVSLDPRCPAPINVFTYQLISTPGESKEREQEIARRQWLTDLLDEGQAATAEEAQARLTTLRENNPRSYRREIAKRYRSIKRSMLYNGADVAPFLHPNARALIDQLIGHGVRTVVLDECHHLLDYWALVLRHLIDRIAAPEVIGLTATLPDPASDRAYENYTGLLGEVDFEVPTPAVVKEGDLAPYRDMVYFVEPTVRERAYLHSVQTAFESAITELTEHDAFRRWVVEEVVTRPYYNEEPFPWERFLQKHPLFSRAGLRFLHRTGYTFPPEMLLPQDADDEMTLEDWAELLERYGLNVLKTSADPADHRRLKRLRKVLYAFGLTLTERGLQHRRSPGDLVLTLSEAKDVAVAEILSAENSALGDQLRAVVVTDFERMSSGVGRLQGVLDRDAGSAVRVFSYLVHHPQAGRLDPILVTGSTLMADADLGEALLERFTDYLKRRNLNARCDYRATEFPQILEVTGQGPDWSSRTYVNMVTEIFESGVTRCLVGTRGIFGEGWDALRLNTLVDLTSITTSTSVQQLRGRTLRKDPSWPRKLAHNWDVVCVSSEFEKGYVDLRRFVKRHDRYWGVVPFSGSGAEMHGAIVKGVHHVDPELAFELSMRNFKEIDYENYTQRMMRQVPLRGQSYALWAVGRPYDNSIYQATRLDGSNLNYRTALTMQSTLRKMLLALAVTASAVFVWGLWMGVQALRIVTGGSGTTWQERLFAFFSLPGIILTLGVVVAVAVNGPQIYRLFKQLLVDQPPEGILLDVGRALLVALRDAGLVSPELQPEDVRVDAQADTSYDVTLNSASPEDAALFIAAFRETLGPVRNPRYLILRDASKLPALPLRRIWSRLRQVVRVTGLQNVAYHPVPEVLGTRKERAEALGTAWRQYVGGGDVVYTRTEEGRKLLLEARAQQRPKVKGMAFEVWR